MNNEQVQEIFVEDIIPNRFQPRLTFDETALQELADSIKVHGVIQPLVLRRVGNKYEIIAGERRYKASCLAGLKKVPAIVRDMNDNESAEVALIENVQRKNLTSIEEAQSYKNLLDRGYLSQTDLANKIGVSQPTIANKMRLLNLCDEVQNALLNEQISERHARSLLQLENPDDQKKMLNRIIKERMTVKQLDNEIKKMLNGNDTTESSEGGNQMEPTTNIFGVNITPPTDLEATAPNLDTSVDDSIPPVSFNPFADVLNSIDNSGNTPKESNVSSEQPVSFDQMSAFSNLAPVESSNVNSVPSDNVQVEQVSVPNVEETPIETFDMFSMFNPAPEINNQDASTNETKKDVRDQIETVRNAIKTIESCGFKVDVEEYDFADMYQMLIKIMK